jgi:hypothetical protein
MIDLIMYLRLGFFGALREMNDYNDQNGFYVRSVLAGVP